MLLKLSYPLSVDDTRVLHLMAMWEGETKAHWPLGVVWFCRIPIFFVHCLQRSPTYLQSHLKHDLRNPQDSIQFQP